jgi:hypothetical protein
MPPQGSRRRRLKNLAVGLAALALTELARAYYRPFVRSRGLNDLHLADTLGNSLGTVTTVFVLLAVFGRGEAAYDRQFLYIAPVSVFLYELAHPLLGRPIDPWDLLATVVAGGLAAGLYHRLHGRLAPGTDEPASPGTT